MVGLKLNKIGRVSWVPDTPATRGMIGKVRHLVRITHDPAAPRAFAGAAAPDEAADIQLLRNLVFDANGIVLEPYDSATLNRGKTPDFKLMKDGELIGYCELSRSLTSKPSKIRPKAAWPSGETCRSIGSWVSTSAARPSNSMPRIRRTTSRTSWCS